MKRIFWIDFGKGLGIFLVVIAHVLANMSNNLVIKSNTAIMTIHSLMYLLFLIIMPIFFAMSGYLFKVPTTINEYLHLLKKKLIVLGIPYLVFSILLVIFSEFLKMHIEGVNGILSLSLIPIYPISYLWFLYALFFCFMVVGYLQLIGVNRFIQYFIYITFALISIKVPTTNISYYLISNFSWILCFYIGFEVKEKNIKIKRSVIIASLILFALSAYLQINTDKLWFVQGDFFTYSNFGAKISSIFLLIALFTKTNNDNVCVKYFRKYGKISLIIYLVHVPIISMLRKFLVKFDINNPYIIFILLVVLSWYISIFISMIFNKVKPLDIIFYPKRYF